jgi:LacI family transcriptional regulator
MATIRDVARESGVSVATVSYVLNNGPRPVKAETRERVLAAMHRLDYHPNAMARGLVRRRLHTIGVLFGQIESAVVTNPYAATLLQGVLSAAADLDYNVTIFPKAWEDARRSTPPLRDRRTDGVLIVAPLSDSDMVPGVAALKIPLVVLSANCERYGVPYVDVDNICGGRLAAEYLLSLGHRRIAHIHGGDRHDSSPLRRQGFLDTLRAAGIATPPEHVVAADYSGHLVPESIQALVSLPPERRPTALFLGNDMMAMRALEVTRARGIRVPEEISLLGFDDIPLAEAVTPPLTTIRQPLVEIAQQATRLLIQQIERGGTLTPDDRVTLGHLMEPAVVQRATTAPPTK